ILHRHLFLVPQQVRQLRFEFLPAEVNGLPAGKMIEGPSFDAMDKFLRFLPCRDAVEEAARREGAVGQIESPAGQEVAAPKVAQEPTVELEFTQSRLNRRQIEHRRLPRGCCREVSPVESRKKRLGRKFNR